VSLSSEANQPVPIAPVPREFRSCGTQRTMESVAWPRGPVTAGSRAPERRLIQRILELRKLKAAGVSLSRMGLQGHLRSFLPEGERFFLCCWNSY